MLLLMGKRDLHISSTCFTYENMFCPEFFFNSFFTANEQQKKCCFFFTFFTPSLVEKKNILLNFENMSITQEKK